jgi:hypothetical protein
MIPQAGKGSIGFRMDRIPPERRWFRSMPIGQFIVTNYPVSQPCQVSSLQAYILGEGEKNLTGCRAHQQIPLKQVFILGLPSQYIDFAPDRSTTVFLKQNPKNSRNKLIKGYCSIYLSRYAVFNYDCIR